MLITVQEDFSSSPPARNYLIRFLRRAAVFSVLVLLAGLGAAPAVSAHPGHLQVANEILNGPDGLDGGKWIAQSFLAPTSFFISSVSLYVADVGTSDRLAVSVRADSAGAPHVTNLTSGSADTLPVAAWVQIDLGSYVELVANQTYWIVARSDAGLGQGYDWWDSGNDVAYANGIGSRSSDGIIWSPRGRDYAFRVHGFLQPRFTFAVTVSERNLTAGTTATLRVNFANAGSGTAASLRINVSLPSELTYLSDDASNLGASRSGSYEFAFTNVLPGTYSFNLTAKALETTPNGTVAFVTVAFDPADHNGASLPRVTRSVDVMIGNSPGSGGPAASTWPWWLLVIAVGGIGLVVTFIAKRRSGQLTVEDVFVSDGSGMLLAHRSSTLIPYQDEDVLVGMFKTVQDFVRDGFSKGTDEQMRALEFGDRKILIERGRGHVVTVVYRGTDYGELAKRVRRVSHEIEEKFGDVIETWDGSMDTVRGITLLLPGVWKGRRLIPTGP